MTREEAISEWTFRSNHIKKWLDEYGEEPSIRHYVELIDMAIEALQFADKSPRTVKLTEDIVVTLDEEAYEIGYTHGQMADRPQGEWILVKGSNGKDYHKCSKCFHTQEITGVKNYCAVCGADMRGKEC